jgi:hypothetical protein
MVVTGYTCWLVDMTERESLMKEFPPEYANVVGHHITLDYAVEQTHPLPTALNGRIVGDAYDKGVQALVVEIDGTTKRPDGETYHITWSLDEGRFPENSKQLLLKGWFPLEQPIEIKLTPAFVMSRPKP